MSDHEMTDAVPASNPNIIHVPNKMAKLWFQKDVEDKDREVEKGEVIIATRRRRGNPSFKHLIHPSLIWYHTNSVPATTTNA
jgi:hypothetical protein